MELLRSDPSFTCDDPRLAGVRRTAKLLLVLLTGVLPVGFMYQARRFIAQLNACSDALGWQLQIF